MPACMSVPGQAPAPVPNLLRRQQVMNQVLKTLLPLQETWVELLATGFSLVHVLLLWVAKTGIDKLAQ